MKLLADIFLVVTLPIIALIAVSYCVQVRVPEARPAGRRLVPR